VHGIVLARARLSIIDIEMEVDLLINSGHQGVYAISRVGAAGICIGGDRRQAGKGCTQKLG
jgi:hypothetical protein